ncbi:protocadherin alpha-5 [Microcaecilia unicolor]|uniref:Protocadherin alpha-5-like n=1 Tax=Microcaecilia unicolor TaxID=1415580 RepID=A0A6P7YQN8_9AMPH|nr:protocadherin alpha-5-like [Microcaecilia unicolor]
MLVLPRHSVVRREIYFILLHSVWDLIFSQIHYTVPEESERGTFVGRIAQDLGLETEELVLRMFRITSKEGNAHFKVNLQNGILFVNRRIDREELCAQKPACQLHLEVMIDKPVTIYRLEVDIEDVNDNSPVFPANEFNLFILESRLPGSRFSLEGALDSDVGINSVQKYVLSPNEYFLLNAQTSNVRSKYVELVLKKQLDREHIPVHFLTLTAFDGGKPPLTGTVQLVITVQDVNDNSPKFDQPDYKIRVFENAVNGTLVLKLNATDLDEGTNGDILYSFSNLVPSHIRSHFNIDSNSGEVRLQKELDFEDTASYEIRVDATDKGHYALAGHCNILVEVLDVNDNPPELTVNSLSLLIPEDSPLGTVIGIFSVSDKDSDVNGKVRCYVAQTSIPFKMKSTFKDYYSLVLDGPIDRERNSEYEIIIIARDEGSPSLSTTVNIPVEITDVNDNAPTFPQPFYSLSVKENSLPGSLIFSVSALDPDLNENAFITYSLVQNISQGTHISSYISVNPQSGSIYSLQSFDHEEVNLIQFKIEAKDSGSPSLSSIAIFYLFVLDENDNAPVILSPFSGADASVIELAPQSAKGEHVVFKIRAMDADSGYNAWLSYQIKEPMNAPFKVGLNTGEIRTTRLFQELYINKQKLVILVKDHGEPPLSATTTLMFSLLESNQDAKLNDAGKDNTNYLTDINIYLIIAIGSISSIFLIFIILYIVLKCHRESQSMVDPGKPTLVCSSTVGSWSYSLQRCYNLRLSGVNSKNDLIIFSPNVPHSSENEANVSGMENQLGKPKHPNPDWRYSASLRAGMQSAVHMEESGVLRGGPGGPEQQWPTVSSATLEPEAGEVSPPVGAGVNSNSWTFKYGPGNPKQPVPPIPPDFPDSFIIPGSPAIISIRQDQQANQGNKGNFITFGKKEETKKRKKKKKGNKNQEKKEKGNSTTDNSDP